MGERIAIIWREGNKTIARDYDHWGDYLVVPYLATTVKLYGAPRNTDELRVRYYLTLQLEHITYDDMMASLTSGAYKKLTPAVTSSADGIILNDFRTDYPENEQGDLQAIYYVRTENGKVYVRIRRVRYDESNDYDAHWEDLGEREVEKWLSDRENSEHNEREVDEIVERIKRTVYTTWEEYEKVR